MGHDMGNSNTSGLQEEENNITQVEGNSVQEAGRSNSADIENHTVSVAEGKDYNQNQNRLASDVPNRAADPHLANQASYERKEEEIEDQPPDESPKIEVKSNDEASDGSNERKLNSISSGSKDQDKPPPNADDKAENHFVPAAEDKDYQEKETNSLPSNIPNEADNPHTVKQIQDEREQEETGVHTPAESPKSEGESNSDGSDTSDNQPTSPSKYRDHEIPKESNSEENLQQHQLEKQTSIKKEEVDEKNSAFDPISSSHDPEPLKFEDSKLDQAELAQVQADPPIQDSNRHIHEDVLAANLNCTSEEDGHRVATKISTDMDESVVSVSNLDMEMSKDYLTVKEVTLEEEVFCEDRLEIKDGEEIDSKDRLEIKDGDEIGCEDILEIKDGDYIGGNDFTKKSKIKSDLPNGKEIKGNMEIPTEISPISAGSTKAEPEITSMEESLNAHVEVSESTGKCVVLHVETILREKESEDGEDKPNDCPTQSCEESVKESKIDSENLSQSEFLVIELVEENKRKRIADFSCYGSEGNMDCIDGVKVAENLVHENIIGQIEASVEHSKDLQKEAEETVVESEILLTESSLTDFKREEVSEERQIIEEIEEKTEASYGIENNTKGRYSGEQCMSTTLLVEQEVSLPMVQPCILQPHEKPTNNEMQSKNIQSSNDCISELRQETCDDIIVTEASCFDSKMAETVVSVAELAIEKYEQDLANHTTQSVMAIAESSIQENHHNEECVKVETPSLSSDDYRAQDSFGRFSTESNPSNSNTQIQMQKSPSFGLDLRIEARTEESDRTLLLYQYKTAIEDFSTEADVSLANPIAHSQSDQNTHQYQAMLEPVEEKVVRMERSDSEKLKTPILGFLKEEEEAYIRVTPQKHENNTVAKKANKETLNLQDKEVASTSPKSKEKRKARSSFFTNCMCCTTVIN